MTQRFYLSALSVGLREQHRLQLGLPEQVAEHPGDFIEEIDLTPDGISARDLAVSIGVGILDAQQASEGHESGDTVNGSAAFESTGKIARDLAFNAGSVCSLEDAQTSSYSPSARLRQLQRLRTTPDLNADGVQPTGSADGGLQPIAMCPAGPGHDDRQHRVGSP